MLTFEGTVNILTAVIVVAVPRLSVLAFVLIIAAWAIITGVAELVVAFRLNVQHGRAWLAVSGVVSIGLGVLLILAPLAGAIVLTWWLGAYALVFGAALLVLAFRLRSRQTHDAPPAGAHMAT